MLCDKFFIIIFISFLFCIFQFWNLISLVLQGLNDRDPAFVGKCCDEMEYDEKCDGGSDTVEDEVCTFSFSYFLLLIIIVTASVYLIKVELMKLPKMLIRKLWNS